MKGAQEAPSRSNVNLGAQMVSPGPGPGPGHQRKWTWRFGDSDFMRWYFTAQVLQLKSPILFSTPGLAVSTAKYSTVQVYRATSRGASTNIRVQGWHFQLGRTRPPQTHRQMPQTTTTSQLDVDWAWAELSKYCGGRGWDGLFKSNPFINVIAMLCGSFCV